MKRSLAVFVALSVAFLGACGDDDDDAADGGTTTSAPSAGGDGEQAAGGGEFCDEYLALLDGDPSPDQIRELADIAPDDAKEPLGAIADGIESDGEAFFDTDGFTDAFGALGAAAAGECADEVIDVTAVDYGFEGMPGDVSPGVLGVSLTNDGEEIHEMVVFRKNDTTTETFDEIFALEDQAAAEELVTPVGGTFVMPGAQSTGLFDVSEAGDYVAVCFIPVGSTPDAGEESDGPPHFTQGMKAEFTVS